MIKAIKTNTNTKIYNYVIATFFCIIIFGEAYLVSTQQYNFKLYGLLIFTFICSFRLKKILHERYYVNLIFSSTILLIISFPFWDSMYNAYSYGGIIVAVLVYTTIRNEFLIIVKYIFYISISK